MIGFNHLGRHGRLGNQMFQYASLRGIADYHNYSFCIPYSKFKNQWVDHQLLEAFLLPNLKNFCDQEAKYKINQIYSEKTFSFDENYLKNCPDNVDLFGYFQTEKYFKSIADSIREDFTFKPEILNPCKKFFKFDAAISLHVRRTDYVEKSLDHPLCSLDYYERSLNQFDSNLPVLVFSDDIKWCKQQSLFKLDRFMISESDCNLIDMCLMSMCSHHIIANSSFSWWGAWLSNSNNVIAPLHWFGENGYTSKNDTKDIIPDKWIKL
jgi:hypothetical protein